MGKSQEWKLALDQYIRQGDSRLAEKSAAWQTAIGLQDVDGLKISEYLLKIAKEHIEGRIDMNAAKTSWNYWERKYFSFHLHFISTFINVYLQGYSCMQGGCAATISQKMSGF